MMICYYNYFYFRHLCYLRFTWNSTLSDLLVGDLGADIPRSLSQMTLREMLVHPSGNTAADFATMAGLPKYVTREDLVRSVFHF